MSKQQGVDCPEVQERDTSKHKKRKGIFELWSKCDTPNMFFTRDWWKVRTYETRELAEKNMKDQTRKWNTYPGIKWIFEVRERKD